jgi:hypothetical protein
VGNHTSQNPRAHGVELKLEGGHDSEVGACAPHTPEEVGVLGGGGSHYLSIGGNDLGGQKVVAGEAVHPGQSAHSAAERESGDSCMGYHTRRRREP